MTKKSEDGNLSSSLGTVYHKIVKRHVYSLTASSRALPNFIVIGAVRCGTTSLYQNICEHPCVLGAKQDEIGFFDSNYHLGVDWYKSFFPRNSQLQKLKVKKGFAITGEDTPFYFWNKLAVERIFQLIPNCRLITILRNPVDRAYSNYQLSIRRGSEKFSFEKAIDIEKEVLDNEGIYTDNQIDLNKFSQPRSNLVKGWYYEQLKLWLDRFPEEQILVISTEELETNPQKTMKRVFQFLKLPEHNLKKFQKLKLAQYEQMDSKIRNELSNYFKPKNEKLFSLIGKKFSWKE
uniref:Putative deacetylase sulfotransferase n=1 Tax=uncultured marine thaumarchaeote KM3_48_E01 TaxID=1456170 RepID=A0A075HBA1_9ARCH|nr:putative deacetylase sulfotransferase [uncultured marine thaumarchaeote KM3_48_E01]